MNGHERHLVVPLAVILVLIGEEADFLKVVCEQGALPFLGVLFHEGTDTIHQFLKVLLPRDVVGLVSLEHFVAQAALAHDLHAQRIGVHRISLGMESLDKLAESVDTRARSSIYTKCLCIGLQGLPHGQLMEGGIGENTVHGGLPDAACRSVDNTLEGLLVVGVHSKAEVGNDILDLLALVE